MNVAYGAEITVTDKFPEQLIKGKRPGGRYDQHLLMQEEETMDTSYFLRWNVTETILARYTFDVSPSVPTPVLGVDAANKKYVDDKIAAIEVTAGAKGDKGEQGEKGDTGEAGAAGATGPKGDTGATGATGPKGDTGATGLQGIKGDTGPQGPAGSASEGGLSEAPTDGKTYGRNSGIWFEIQHRLPVFTSTETWTTLPRGLNVASPMSGIEAFSYTGNTIYATINGGQMSRSDDNGASWTALTSGQGRPNPYSSCLAIASDGNFVIIGSKFGEGAYSNDKGNTWTQISKAQFNSGRGESSSASEGASVDILGFAMSGNIIVALFELGYASRSTDKGKTWTSLPRYLGTSSTMSQYRSSGGIAVSGNVMVAVLEDGNAARSADLGVTWTALPIYLNTLTHGATTSIGVTVVASGNTFIASIGNGYVSRSTDAGLTWTSSIRNLEATIPNSVVKTLSIDGLYAFAGMTNGYSCDSIDGGATWRRLPYSLNMGQSGNHFLASAIKGSRILASGGSGYASMRTSSGVTFPTNPIHGDFGIGSDGSGIYVFVNGKWVSYVQEAPSDNKPYLRQDGMWVPYVPSSGGIEEAPDDGNAYIRTSNSWMNIDDYLGTGEGPM